MQSGNGVVESLTSSWLQIISNRDISDAIEQMHQQHRYGEILFIADTCHAESLIADITSPNVIAVASSGRHEDSYSVEVSRARVV